MERKTTRLKNNSYQIIGKILMLSTVAIAGIIFFDDEISMRLGENMVNCLIREKQIIKSDLI